MERVKKGEKYWVVYLIGDKCKTCMMIEGQNCPATPTYDSDCFQFGNYFSSEASAEAMAEKIRKVLKGADVIEIPSEDEIEDAMKTSVTESIMCVSPCNSFTPQATDLLECAWMKGAEWLKSKIIK